MSDSNWTERLTRDQLTALLLDLIDSRKRLSAQHDALLEALKAEHARANCGDDGKLECPVCDLIVHTMGG